MTEQGKIVTGSAEDIYEVAFGVKPPTHLQRLETELRRLRASHTTWTQACKGDPDWRRHYLRNACRDRLRFRVVAQRYRAERLRQSLRRLSALQETFGQISLDGASGAFHALIAVQKARIAFDFRGLAIFLSRLPPPEPTRVGPQPDPCQGE